MNEPTMDGKYGALSRGELELRLLKAERLCYMFGICASHSESDREKAAYEVWREWLEVAGDAASEPGYWSDLDSRGVKLLAKRRDATREAALRRITS